MIAAGVVLVAAIAVTAFAVAAFAVMPAMGIAGRRPGK